MASGLGTPADQNRMRDGRAARGRTPPPSDRNTPSTGGLPTPSHGGYPASPRAAVDAQLAAIGAGFDANKSVSTEVLERTLGLETVPHMTVSTPWAGRSAVGTIVAAGDDSHSATSGLSQHTPLDLNLRPMGSAKPAPKANSPIGSPTNQTLVSSGQGSAPLVK